jgi:F0F1-type ATP synthase membrane subunit c/vacuolar-type H+-ATPase subunit K
MAVTMIGTALAVGLAEAYSEVVGSETRTRRRIAREELRHLAVQSLAVGFGVVFPAVFFILAAADAMEVETRSRSRSGRAWA